MFKKYLEWVKKHKVMSAVAAIVVVIALLGSLSPKEQNQSKTPQQNSSNPAETTQQSETSSKPAKAYEKLDTKTIQNIRAYTHYRYTGSTKPTIEEIKKLMVEIERLGCGEPRICNYFLWDSKEAYEAGKDNVDGRANEVAAAHKDHLAGYINSGFAFYYYGTTGDGSGNLTVLDPGTGTYTDF